MNLLIIVYLIVFTATFFLVLRHYLGRMNFVRIKNFIDHKEKEMATMAEISAKNMTDVSMVVEADMRYFSLLKKDLERLTQNFEYKKNELSEYIRQVDKAYIALSRKNSEMGKILEKQNFEIQKINSFRKEVNLLENNIQSSVKMLEDSFVDKEKKLDMFEERLVLESKALYKKLQNNLEANLKKTIGQLEQKHSQQIYQFSANLSETQSTHETLSEGYKKLLADMEGYRDNLQSDISGVVDVMIDEFKEKINVFEESTMESLTTTYKNLQKQADETKLEFSQREEQMANDFAQMKKENELFKNKFFDKNANYIQTLQSQLKELMGSFEEIENSYAASKARLENVNDFFTEAEDLVSTKVNTQSVVFDKRRKELESFLQKKVNVVEKDAEAFLQTINKEQERHTATTKKQMAENKKILQTQKELERELLQSFSKQNKKFANGLDAVLDEAMKKVISSGEEKTQRFVSELSQLLAQQKKSTAASEKEVIKIRENISKKIDVKHMTERVLKDISATIEEDVHSAFVLANKKLVRDLDKTKTSIELANKEITAIEKGKKQALQKMVDDFQEKVQRLEGTLVKDISTKTSVLEKNIKEIGRRVDSFLKETTAFKKTEKLAKSLKSELKVSGEHLVKAQTQNVELKKTVKIFEGFLKEKASIEKFNDRLKDYQQQMKAVEKSIVNFDEEQNELGKQFKRWDANKEEITIFLEKSGQYKTMASSARREMEKLVSSREQAQTALEAIKSWQKRIKFVSDSSLHIEKRVENSEKMEAALKEKLEDLEMKSAYLQENYRNLGDFQTKYDQLDFLVEDMDVRMKSFEEMRRKILLERNEMQELRNKFDEQIKTVLQLTYAAVPTGERKVSDNKEVITMVRRLNAIGWKRKEIAEQLNIPLSEVDLYVEK